MRVMSRCAFLLLGLLPCGAGAAQRLPSVRERLAARVAQAPATGVGLYYRSLTHPDSLLLDANVRFHAASTMKLPVLINRKSTRLNSSHANISYAVFCLK